MERILPRKTKPKPISLLEAAKLMEAGEEPFVLFPTDGDFTQYERKDLEEFLGDCLFFVER